MIQRFVRRAEVCRQCGAVDKFAACSTVYVYGQKRVYMKCAACGAHAVRVYEEPREEPPKEENL